MLTKEQLANVIGRAAARRVFDRRSRKSNGYRNVEVHMSEDDLAAVVEAGVLEAMRRKHELEGQS